MKWNFSFGSLSYFRPEAVKSNELYWLIASDDADVFQMEFEARISVSCANGPPTGASSQFQ